MGLGLQTGRPRRAGGHLPDHPPALLHRHRQPSRSLLSWTARVDGTRTTCRGPATCRQRSMIAMVRVLTGSPLSSCAPSVGAGGLTLTIVRGPVKSTVRSASEGIYRPIWPLRRIRWRLKCASRSSRTSGHRRVLSRRACGPMDRHAVTVCHDGESGEAAALTGDYALVLLDLRCPARPGSTCSERSARMKEPASDRADRARSRRPERGLDRGANE